MTQLPITNYSPFPLHPLTIQEVEEFLRCHPKYLCNPLTDKEKALIRDIISVCRPMTNLEPVFPCGVKIRGK
jgi:hypothetical protein